MSPVEYTAICEGHFEKERNDWMHTRQICWMIYSSNADPKKAVKNIDLWWKMPKNTRELPKKESKAAFKKKLDKALETLKGKL